MKWSELKFWDSGEWQAIHERFNDLRKKGVIINPERKKMFRALTLTPLEKTKVAFIGQDPYPNPIHATGLAFSVPETIKDYPPTLKNIFLEYSNDLHYPDPPNGNLTKWATEGVLLWNAIPSCEANLPASHRWCEWEELTKEIILELDNRNILLVFLGKIAKEYTKYINNSDYICISHPSPLGANASNNPFLGSRIFTTVNSKLKEPIDWKL